ncbi:hypothetical protein O6935_04840, partial [Chlamydia sp. 26-15]
SKKTLEEAEKAYQKAFAVVEDLNKNLHEKEKALEALNLVSSYQDFQFLLKKQISSQSLIIDLLEQLIGELQIRLFKIQEEEERLQKRLQGLQSVGSFDKQAVEKLEKEIEKLRKEKSSSKDELRIRLEQLHKETKEAGEVTGKTKLNSEQIQCIIEELEKQLKEAQAEIENKEQRIQDLEKELADLKNLSTGDQESLQDEIHRLRELSSKDNQKITDLVDQSKRLAVLTERNAILEQRLDQLERRRKQEAFVYEDRLIEIRQVYQEELEKLDAQHTLEIEEIKLRYKEEIDGLERSLCLLKDELRMVHEAFDQKVNDELVEGLRLKLKKLKTTLVLYDHVIEHYEDLLQVEPVLLEQFIKDKAVLKEIQLGNEVYSRKDIVYLDATFEEELCDAQNEIANLKHYILTLKEDLKSLTNSNQLQEKLQKLTEDMQKLQASLKETMSSLTPEQQKMVQMILDDMD